MRVSYILLVVGAAACSSAATPRESLFAELKGPAGPRSGEPFLSVDARDRLHMTWLEQTGESTFAVRYARLDDSTWSAPSTIAERTDLFVNWADFPAVVASPSGRLVAHWLQRSGAGKYAYDARVAQSVDDGRTWSAGRRLHTDSAGASEHGFVALWTSGPDQVHAAWLDGRDMSGGHGESRGAMSLRYTSIGPDGATGREDALDLRTCECCQVNAAVGASGPIVVYRDRSESDTRDIAVVRTVGGVWASPAPVHNDGWHVEGCPVNGPAVAAHGDTAVVVWFTGAQDTARVRVAWSMDGGATFGPPVRVDGGSPAGRVDVELLPDGSAAVVWLERVSPERGDVRLRRVGAGGALGTMVTLASTPVARPAGFPKLVRRGRDLIAAWTVPGDSSRVRLARMATSRLPALP